MLSRTVHPNILNHSLWWGSCSLCFCRVNSGSSMAEELVRGTKRTLPSADCCRLYSYGEYWFPSGSRRCCRMTQFSSNITVTFHIWINTSQSTFANERFLCNVPNLEFEICSQQQQHAVWTSTSCCPETPHFGWEIWIHKPKNGWKGGGTK